ncbi:MAG TPA: hypothetical protein V6C78_16245 [Crinalium sp.]|jgi:hypothetical protein
MLKLLTQIKKAFMNDADLMASQRSHFALIRQGWVAAVMPEIA